MTRRRGSENSSLMVVLVSIGLTATPVLSAQAQAPHASESDAVSGAASSDPGEPELRVPPRIPSEIPEGEEVELDSLLRLPSGFLTTQPSAVAGAGEAEWRRRFTKADRELSEARASLTATKTELDSVAVEGGASQWSIAAPGGSGGNPSSSTSPLSFKLRQQLREDRERIETTEKAMRALRIEADLAGVPQDWRVLDSNSREPDKK